MEVKRGLSSGLFAQRWLCIFLSVVSIEQLLSNLFMHNQEFSGNLVINANSLAILSEILIQGPGWIFFRCSR